MPVCGWLVGGIMSRGFLYIARSSFVIRVRGIRCKSRYVRIIRNAYTNNIELLPPIFSLVLQDIFFATM